jgi:hypothetical protein
MADQRRRGRGRSGRGGRIPKRGEAPAPAQQHGELFVSFPLDPSPPIEVAAALDAGSVGAALRETLEAERRQAGALQAVAAGVPGPALSELLRAVERHRDLLEGLARDLGADPSPEDGEAPPAEAPDLRQVVADHHRCRLGWLTLRRAAYASGDRRIDRVVRSVLRDKERHTAVLEEAAIRQAVGRFFPEPEE